MGGCPEAQAGGAWQLPPQTTWPEGQTGPVPPSAGQMVGQSVPGAAQLPSQHSVAPGGQPGAVPPSEGSGPHVRRPFSQTGPCALAQGGRGWQVPPQSSWPGGQAVPPSSGQSVGQTVPGAGQLPSQQGASPFEQGLQVDGLTAHPRPHAWPGGRHLPCGPFIGPQPHQVSPAAQIRQAPPSMMPLPPSHSQAQSGSPAGQAQTQPPGPPASTPTPQGSPLGWQTPLQRNSPAGQPPAGPPSHSHAQFGSPAGQAQLQPPPQGSPLGWQAPLQRVSPAGQPPAGPPSQSQLQVGSFAGHEQAQGGFPGQAMGQAVPFGMQLPLPLQPQKDSLGGQQAAAGGWPAGSIGQLTTQLAPLATQLPDPLAQPQKYWPEGQQPGGGLPASGATQTCEQAWVSGRQEPWPLQPQKYSLAGQQTETGAGPASTVGLPASQSQVQVGSLAGQAQAQAPPLPLEGWAGQLTTQATLSGTQVPVPLPQPQRYWPAGQQPPPLQVHCPLGWQTGCRPKAQGGSGPVQPVPASAGQMAGQATPEAMQMPLPLQPQKVSFKGQGWLEPEAAP